MTLLKVDDNETTIVLLGNPILASEKRKNVVPKYEHEFYSNMTTFRRGIPLLVCIEQSIHTYKLYTSYYFA